ncbi:DUF6030 family protein [Rhizobium terrae]|uniref:DUF6030 family protein n=1 Tax=Rhizobium terrae TaxID=2171756 RepID=UPI000E3EDD42|nr:DUF6030 family protein [Rhizobium terrae]
MPEEDKAKKLTPADRRRRQRSSARVFVLFLVMVLTALATTVLAVNNGRNYKRLIRQLGLAEYLLPPPADLRVDRQRQLPPADHYPAWLISAQLERAAVFEKTEPISAEERCDLLKSEKGTRPEFTTSDNNWECLFFEEFGTSPEPGSLFIQARGALPDRIRSFRIKLSLTEAAVEIQMLQGAVAAIERFGLPMAPETRSYLADMLATRREFSSIVENYRMTFSPEMTDARRYNLLILPRPQTITCSGLPPSSDPSNASTYRMPIGCLPLRAPALQPKLAS